MKRFLQGSALLVGALLLQILSSHWVPLTQRSVDLVLLVVVYYGSSGARVGSMMAGAVGGVLEDVWFNNIVGLHGFTKSLIGYLLGGLGARFDLTGPASRLVALLLATVIERLVEPLVLLGLGLHASLPDPLVLLWRCLGNVLVGALLFFSLAGTRKPKTARKRRLATA
jgi:rod shape-determining protein MreD